MNDDDIEHRAAARARDLEAPAVLALSALVAFAIASPVYAHEARVAPALEPAPAVTRAVLDPPKLVHR